MVYCLGYTKPKLVMVDEALAKDLGPRRDKLTQKGVGPVSTLRPTRLTSGVLLVERQAPLG